MFLSSSRPIPPYGSITLRPIPVGSIRSRSGFPKFNAMSSLGGSLLPRLTYPESWSVTSNSTTKPPHPSAGELRILIIALNQSLNEPLTQCTRLPLAINTRPISITICSSIIVTLTLHLETYAIETSQSRCRTFRSDPCIRWPACTLLRESVQCAHVAFTAQFGTAQSRKRTDYLSAPP